MVYFTSLPACFGYCRDVTDRQLFLKKFIHSSKDGQTVVFGIRLFLFAQVFAWRPKALGSARPSNQTAWTARFEKNDGRKRGEEGKEEGETEKGQGGRKLQR